ncbi:MAG: acetate--CoA ligase family protein [Streptosporangiales bacterium]|nr:acetate--CoA ligase family protein [Streptosporangiales bacterium]
MYPDLDPLFHPKRIGIAGLSSREQTWGRRTLSNLRDGGFDGEIVAIAPRTETDVPSVADLADLDAPLDLLLVALPAAAVPPLLERAARTGAARSALVFSSGFRESGPDGGLLEDQLATAAAGLPVVGPNGVGLLSRPGSTVATVSAYVDRKAHPPAGPIAIVSQSGALGFVAATLLERHGVSVSYYVSAGNEACLGLGELGGYLIERPDVATLGLYIESVRDADTLRQVARRARQLGKRVVALKAGATPAGQRATLSHTAAVAGDALLFRRLCDDEGIVLADSDEAFADLLHAAGRPATAPPRPRLAIVTMTGGGGAILADRLAAVGASVPALSQATRDRIAGLQLASIASDTNPVDIGGGFYQDADKLPDLLKILDSDPDIDGVVGVFTFGDRFPGWYRDLAGHLAGLGKPGWMVWAAGLPEHRTGLPPGTVFDTIESFVRGLPAAIQPPDRALTDLQAAPDAAVTALAAHRRHGLQVITEADARDIVIGLGCEYVPTLVLEPGGPLPPGELPAGDRYVVKADTAEVTHRAKAGLIRLGVPASQVNVVTAELRAVAPPGSRIVIQPMAGQRAELAVGAVRDPQYGPAVIVGGGGTDIEDERTVRFALLAPAHPDTVTEVVSAVNERFGPLDTDALASLVANAAALIGQRPELTELDINPVLVRPDGTLVAVDALAVLAAPEENT